MTFPEVQFVAAPEDGAAVLFDFNDAAAVGAKARVMRSGFSLGTPALLGDPDGLGVEYGARTVVFTLEIAGTRGAALATQAALARTFMLRRRGWLRVQLDALSEPHWLRTYTPTPGELDFNLVFIEDDTDTWRIGVQVAAEPLIRDERIELWSGTINNSAIHATNPMGVLLPDVIGDAAAPLRIEAEFLHSRHNGDITWACSVVPPAYAPTVWQFGATGGGGTDFWTGINDTSAAAGFSYRRITFNTVPGMAERLHGTPPSIAPGRYRVSVRCGKDATTPASFRMKFGRRFDLDSARIVTFDWPDTPGVHDVWVELGEMELPYPRTLVDMASVSAAPPALTLYAEQVSGTADLILDAIRLDPIELASTTDLERWEQSTILAAEFVGTGPAAGVGETHVWDGDEEVTVRRTSTGVLDGSVSGACRGKFPTVQPGHTHWLSLYQQTRAIFPYDYDPDSSDLPGSSATVSVSYQPRRLWLGED